MSDDGVSEEGVVEALRHAPAVYLSRPHKRHIHKVENGARHISHFCVLG